MSKYIKRLNHWLNVLNYEIKLSKFGNFWTKLTLRLWKNCEEYCTL